MQRNLMGCSPWAHKGSDTTEQVTLLLCYLHRLFSRSSNYSYPDFPLSVEGRGTMEVPWLRQSHLFSNIHFPFHCRFPLLSPWHLATQPQTNYPASTGTTDFQTGGISAKTTRANPWSSSWADLFCTCSFLLAGTRQSHLASLGPQMTCCLFWLFFFFFFFL